MKSLFYLTLFTVSVSAETYAQEITLGQRLEGLVETLETKQAQYHIPGMQLAVVLKDEVIFVHSFGELNTELGLPVTNKTLFPIGSVTKSFTAAAVGTLVDEGKMKWDAPITEYLPEFVLPFEIAEGDSEDATILLSDLLSHQTGFTRFQFLGMNNSLSHKEMLDAAVLAEPVSTLHNEFCTQICSTLQRGMQQERLMGATGTLWLKNVCLHQSE